MISTKTLPLFAILGATVIAAACGGGSGSAINNPGGGGNPTPTPAPTSALPGTLNLVTGGAYPAQTYGPAGTVSVDFSCGCTSVAGSATTDGAGNFTLVAVSTPVPAPNPMYTIVPGRNYLIVGNPTAGSQAWTVEFAGKIPSHNVYLNAANQSDVYTVAVGLYVFNYSSGGSVAFDGWNFNQLLAWYNQLKSSPTTAEKALLSDIVTQSEAASILWPKAPTWRPTLSPINSTIKSDLATVHANSPPDPQLPTPCPGGACTGTPTP